MKCVKKPFPRITYDEAVNILKKNGVDFQYGKDFGGADETIISNQYDSPVMIHRWPVDTKAFYMKRDEGNKDLAKGVDMIAPEGYGEIVGGGQREDDIEILIETIISNQYDSPVMIHRWPVDTKAFYMKRDEDNKDLAKGVDMIAPEGYGEIVGGGQREDDIEILIETIRHHDLPLKPFEWYLDLRRYGSVPHSGFGLGLERFVAWICGTKHIRETIPFPRTMARLEP